ncbi:MAG: response regulator transcription factor [Gammaproteobacteria bacterium]
MRILVIEDEAALREQIAARLRAENYAVDTAADGRNGLFQGNEYPVDVAVVDIGLPQLSGLDVIRSWRQAGRKFPILILTARGRWQEKVEGLEAGADDYLVKPFHIEELLARLRALMRRAEGWAQDVLRCDPITLNTSTQGVTVGGQPVELTAFEYKLLEYLMLHAGEVVGKGELSDHTYEEDMDRDSNVLEVLVGRLRRKLDPERTLNPIETLRGRGYRFRLQRSA